MATEEEINNIVLKEKETRLSISRVPKNTKLRFIELAENEFDNDYGQLLKWLLDQAVEYQNMKYAFFENINYKLDTIIANSEQSQSEPEEEYKIKTMLSGRKIKIKKKEVKNG